MQWQSCPTNPLSWFAWREVLLTVLLTPSLLLPLASCVALLMAWWLQLPRQAGLTLTLLTPLTLSIFYSSAATALLSGWLLAQLPPAPTAPPAHSGLPVAGLVGRGPEVAAAARARLACTNS